MGKKQDGQIQDLERRIKSLEDFENYQTMTNLVISQQIGQLAQLVDWCTTRIGNLKDETTALAKRLGREVRDLRKAL